MTPLYEIVVVDGLKNGARAPLLSDQAITIGDHVDCDIVLGELTIEEREPNANTTLTKATLHHDSTTGIFTLQVAEGSIQLNDTPLAAGSATQITSDTPVNMGDSTFEVRRVHTGAAPEPILEDQLITTQSATIPLASNTYSGVKKFGLAAALCTAIAVGLSFWINDQYFSVTAHDRASTVLQQIMARPEFSQIVLEQSGDGAIKVVGHVQQRSHLHQLRHSLNGTEKTVYIDVSVGEIMAESVASVFRVNDLEAVASSVASGEVLVQTISNDLQLLKKVEAIAYADVAGLKSLKIENSPPAVVKSMEKPAKNDFETMPGKRIVMVVATEPTYILTEDGSRYFTGSILPSGHKVKAILEQKVELELDQNTIEVTF